jgi:hypothetical protein
LSETGLSQEDRLELSKKLKESTAKIKHCEENLEKLNLDRNSEPLVLEGHNQTKHT